MSPPEVFISATSADLGPMRQVVKEALLTIGCMPVEQTNFPPDWRTVSQMLREKIGDCQALIHVAGLHYGAEPDPGSSPTSDPRRSYTQMDYDMACELQRKRGDRRFRVYTFICPENFPYLPVAVAEDEEKRKLQAQHRSRIQDGAALYERPQGPDPLKARVLALREEVLALRAMQDRRVQLTLAGVVFIVLALGGIGYYQYQSRQDIADLPTETAEEVARQFNPEAVATRLTQEIHARFERDAQAARLAGEKWEAVRDLERSR